MGGCVAANGQRNRPSAFGGRLRLTWALTPFRWGRSDATAVRVESGGFSVAFALKPGGIPLR